MGGTLLHLLLKHKEELAGNVIVVGIFGCRDCSVDPEDVRKVSSRFPSMRIQGR